MQRRLKQKNSLILNLPLKVNFDKIGVTKIKTQKIQIIQYLNIFQLNNINNIKNLKRYLNISIVI